MPVRVQMSIAERPHLSKPTFSKAAVRRLSRRRVRARGCSADPLTGESPRGLRLYSTRSIRMRQVLSGKSPVKSIALSVTQNRCADPSTDRQPAGTVVPRRPGRPAPLPPHRRPGAARRAVHRHDIPRHLPGIDDDGAFDLVLQLEAGRRRVQRDQIPGPLPDRSRRCGWSV